MNPRALRLLLALALAAGAARQAEAQSNFAPTPPSDGDAPRPPGWTFTPGIAFSTAWDDNVLVRENRDNPIADTIGAVNPIIAAGYEGRQTQIDARYDGVFSLYRQFEGLNSFDQQAALFARHRMTKRVSLFATATMALAPTTELVALVGVPFVRTGSTVADAHGGATIALGAHQTVTASYNFQWIGFQTAPQFAQFLRGGRTQGATAGWRRGMSKAWSISADYDVSLATVRQGPRLPGTPDPDFAIHNGWIGFEVRPTERTRAYAAGGFSRVGVTALSPPRTGPAWRGGWSVTGRRTGADVSYSRSYVPSYSFGGTLQNEEINARVHRTFTRRLSGQAMFSWRSNDSLVFAEPSLRSAWVEASLGYSPQPWLRLEGFYTHARQRVDRPGGKLDRNRVGFQIVASNPVRVR